MEPRSLAPRGREICADVAVSFFLLPASMFTEPRPTHPDQRRCPCGFGSAFALGGVLCPATDHVHIPCLFRDVVLIFALTIDSACDSGSQDEPVYIPQQLPSCVIFDMHTLVMIRRARREREKASVEICNWHIPQFIRRLGLLHQGRQRSHLFAYSRNCKLAYADVKNTYRLTTGSSPNPRLSWC